MATATGGPVEGMEQPRKYIVANIMVGPAKPVPRDWAYYSEIPFHEELEDQGNVAEGVRRDLVQFISASGLPITLEPALGMGSAAGGLTAAKEALAVLKLLRAAGGFIARTQRSVREEKRRAHLPRTYIMLITNDATEVVVPLVAMLPDLVKHLHEKRPAMQFEFLVADRQNSIWTAPGAPITDGAVLKVLKRIEKGDRFIGIRNRSWSQWRTVKGFREDEHAQWATFKMPPGMRDVLPSR